MKKIKLLLLFVVLFEVMLPSCKKGENDPFLTLHTRKARITGEWKLKSGTITYTYNDTTQNITLNGINAAITASTIDLGTFYTESNPYTEKWTINKDYTFEMVKNNFNYQIMLSGYWSFYNKDKDMGLKNKEAIIFRITTKKYVYAVSSLYNSTYSYTGTYCPTYLYFIDQLKNKEIIVKYEGTSIWSDFNEYEIGNFTFTQEKD